MPVYSLKIAQTYNGQQCINEWHYLGSGTPAAVTMSFALASAFGCIESGGAYDPGTPFGSMKAFQTTDVSYQEVITKNLYSVTDFYTTAFAVGAHGDSSNASGAQPSFMAYPFRTNRVRTDIRRGQKRYVGIAEANVDNFGTIAGATFTALAAHAALLSDNLTYDDEGNTLTFSPCVIQLKKDVTDPDNPKYIPWPTEAEQLAHLAQGVVWTALPAVTTQNSRKIGRGS